MHMSSITESGRSQESRDSLVEACDRAHRLWMTQPDDPAQTIELSQRLFELQVALERLEVRTQDRLITVDDQVQIAHVTARLRDLEAQWQGAELHLPDLRTEI